MIRRIIFIVFIVLSVAATIAGYFYLRAIKKPKKEAITLIPADCSFILECDNPAAFSKKLSGTNMIWEELKHESYFSGLDSSLQLIDSLLLKDEAIHDLYLNSRLYIAAYRKNNSYTRLFAFNLSNLNLQENITSFLKSNCSSFEHIETPEKNTIIRCIIKGFYKPLFAYSNEGCVLISEDRELLEQCLSKDLRSIAQDTHFLKLEEDGGNNMDMRLFIRNSFYEHLIAPDKYTAFPLHNHNEWTALDFISTPNEFRFNGFIDSDSSTQINALLSQEPVEIKFTEFIPSTTVSFSFLGISNYNSYYNASVNTDELNTLFKNYSLNTEAGLLNDWNEIFAGEMAEVSCIIDNRPETFGIATVQEGQAASQLFKSISDSTLLFQNNGLADSIYMFKNGDIFNVLTCNLINSTFNYAYISDEHIYFGKSDSLIKKILQTISSYGTLAKSERFAASAESNLNNRCNFYYYNDLSSAGQEFSSIINPEALRFFHKPEERIKKFGFAGIQLSTHRGKILVQSCLHYNPVTKVQSLTLWEAQLDTIAENPPQLLLNHKTGGKEVFVSDNSGTIYLISNTGKIQWKKKLGEKVLSQVYQVDYYKNGKLQMLLNTTNQLHLIDRNGNYIPGYPVQLPSPCTNPIAVYDYENNKDYRILFASENKQVYNYNISGKPVEGFEFPHSKEIISLPIDFKRINGKDYLFACDNDGNIYCTGRKGETRISFTNKLNPFCKTYFFDQGKDLGRCFFCFFDASTSTLNYLSLDNKLKSHTVETDLKIKSVNYEFINEDKLIDCILSDETGFIILDDEANKLLNYISKTDIRPSIKTISVNNQLYFIVCTPENRLQIINADGKPLPDKNFLFSSLPTLAFLNGDGIPYLIGVCKSKVNCYEFRD